METTAIRYQAPEYTPHRYFLAESLFEAVFVVGQRKNFSLGKDLVPAELLTNCVSADMFFFMTPSPQPKALVSTSIK